ncbi:hypothetical protein BS50DRAFT_485106 [Corynespora cassiicola Philippines]|uniref:PARP catalytic domain-containing protein n=1 Tax=Corynespora cassiicola Philippines TaxID=1448308 RepID=A0A2T2P4M4_CORCC|nr:hypothetical protein BS50DRAFT_485106 [Corynespora cassiicola Philippines]
MEIIEANIPQEVNYRGYVPFQTYTFGFNEIELKISVDLANTKTPLTSHVVNENFALSRKVIDGLRWALRDIIKTELVAHEECLTLFGSGLMVLRLLEETTSHIQDYRQAIAPKASKCKENYWDVRKPTHIAPLLNQELKMKGVDLDTVHGAATQILGKTPAQICHDILPEWRIMHCENIMRNNLKDRFFRFQKDLSAKLMEANLQELKPCVPIEHRRTRDGQATKEQLVEYLTKPRLTFHGTRRDLVPSIVQNGFLKPGDVNPITKQPLPIANGSAYGQGIYSSPEAWYALMYSQGSDKPTKPSEMPGLKLLVCATIMGRTAVLGHEDKWTEQMEPWPGADSHVNQSQWAYIVFNSAQILPCYVLHLDWAGEDDDEVYNFVSSFANKPPRSHRRYTDAGISPGEKQRKKEERIAKGQKFFAGGFGPIAGNRLVIEDVAEVDDDEEDYGDYQSIRINAQFSNTSIWDDDWGKGVETRISWDLEGETAIDEYADARKGTIKKAF